MPTPPRIPPETRQEAAIRVEEVLDALEREAEAADILAGSMPADSSDRLANAAIDAAWAKLLGDARDRVAHLIEAADAYLCATERTRIGKPPRPASDIAAKRRGLKRALAMLEAEDDN